MLLLTYLLKAARVLLLAILSLIASIGGILALFRPPPFIQVRLDAIANSDQAHTFWFALGLCIDTIWFLFTDHTGLVGIVWLGSAFIWYLYSDPLKDELKRDYDDVRQRAREAWEARKQGGELKPESHADKDDGEETADTDGTGTKTTDGKK